MNNKFKAILWAAVFLIQFANVQPQQNVTSLLSEKTEGKGRKFKHYRLMWSLIMLSQSANVIILIQIYNSRATLSYLMYA